MNDLKKKKNRTDILRYEIHLPLQIVAAKIEMKTNLICSDPFVKVDFYTCFGLCESQIYPGAPKKVINEIVKKNWNFKSVAESMISSQKNSLLNNQLTNT